MSFTNMDKVMARINAMKGKVQDESLRVIKANAQQAVEEMKSTVAVDTGELRKSIQAVNSGSGVTVEATADHAWFVEHGTYKMPAQPFFEPAIEQMKRNNERDLKNILKGL